MESCHLSRQSGFRSFIPVLAHRRWSQGRGPRAEPARSEFHRKTAQTIGQFVPSSPDAGLVRQHLELLVDQIDECIGMGVAVIGDELPDFS